jgi:N-acetylmuramoyl-L-alanine amidase
MAKRKRNSKNRLISASFIFIWVILLGVCIFVYRSNKASDNNTVSSINNNKVEATVEIPKDNNKNENNNLKTDEQDKQHNKNHIEKTESLTEKDEDLSKDNTKKEDDNLNNNEKSQPDKNIDKPKKESTQKNIVDKSTVKNSDSGKKQESKQSTESKNETKKEPVNIVTFDPNNRVIVIDPGHANRSNSEKEPIAPGSSTMKIKDGGGAVGRFTKVPEYEVAMEVSKILKILLEKKGFTVIMTKTENDVSLGNVERAHIGNEANAALVIRVHADSYEKSSAHGATMLVPDKTKYTEAIYDESKRCGEIVMNTLVEQVGMHSRGLKYRSDLTGFNWSKVPVILVELGFMSNEEEDMLLASPEYQDRLAKGLADGIEKALYPIISE